MNVNLELPEYTSPNESHDQLKCLALAAKMANSLTPLNATVILRKIKALINSNNYALIAPICDAILICACSNAHNQGKKERTSSSDAKVYFLQRNDGMIKIGYAKDVHKRINQLRGPNGSELNILLVLDGGQPLETTLHKRFSPDNHFGEWFRPSLELRSFIKMHVFDQNAAIK